MKSGHVLKLPTMIIYSEICNLMHCENDYFTQIRHDRSLHASYALNVFVYVYSVRCYLLQDETINELCEIFTKFVLRDYIN